MRKALFCAAIAAALCPATAEADIFEGSTTDDVGETTPAHDIAAISARYDDRAGEVTVSVQLVGAGGRDDRRATSDGTAGEGLRREPAGRSSATAWWRTRATRASGASTTTRPTRPLVRSGHARPRSRCPATHFGALAYEGYDCLTVATHPDAQSTYDQAEITLTNVTPAPTPAPTPVPTATPTPTPPPLGPSPLTRAEQLEAALAKCTSKKCRTSARKRYGPTRREQYRAALERCKSKACERRAKARYAGVKAAPKPTGLERRLYAHGASDIMGAVRRDLLGGARRSSTAAIVYVGLPEGAGVPNCTRVSYDASKEEGCSTYKVAGKSVTIAATGRKYTIGKDLVRQPTGDEKEKTTLERQVFPSVGSRWDVPKIEAIWVSGSPFVGTQIITKTYLTLTREGQFVKSSFSFGSSAPGVDPSIAFTSAPRTRAAPTRSCPPEPSASRTRTARWRSARRSSGTRRRAAIRTRRACTRSTTRSSGPRTTRCTTSA